MISENALVARTALLPAPDTSVTRKASETRKATMDKTPSERTGSQMESSSVMPIMP